MGDKPGYKTTEFWITIGIAIVSAVLMAFGNTEAGAALMALTGGSYSISRAVAK